VRKLEAIELAVYAADLTGRVSVFGEMRWDFNWIHTPPQKTLLNAEGRGWRP